MGSRRFKIDTCIHVSATFGSFSKLINVPSLIILNFNELVITLDVLPKGF